MAETTIEWTRGPRGELGYTFNGWIGCEKISPGCENCYAAAQDKFRGWTPEGWGGPRRRTSDENWKKPERWNEAAAAAGERRRVFCSSLADVFDNKVPPEWRADLFRLIAATPHLDWLLLTKRIGNAAAMLRDVHIALGEQDEAKLPAWPWPNVWLGATVVNQEEADRDIPKLLATPARVRFLSMEPLLGPVQLRERQSCGDCDPCFGGRPDQCAVGSYFTFPEVDWVIVGGESGPGARPMHPDWARSIRDQCAAAGVPFLFKQVGEAVPVETDVDTDHGHTVYPLDDSIVLPGERYKLHTALSGQYFVRVPKKAAGRLLDGVTHDGFPEVR